MAYIFDWIFDFFFSNEKYKFNFDLFWNRKIKSFVNKHCSLQQLFSDSNLFFRKEAQKVGEAVGKAGKVLQLLEGKEQQEGKGEEGIVSTALEGRVCTAGAGRATSVPAAVGGKKI